MLNRQLRTVLEEIFGADFVEEALSDSESAQQVIYRMPDEFKKTVLGFQRLNYRDEQSQYAQELDRQLGCALICSLLDNSTRELVAELGLNYL